MVKLLAALSAAIVLAGCGASTPGGAFGPMPPVPGGGSSQPFTVGAASQTLSLADASSLQIGQLPMPTGWVIGQYQNATGTVVFANSDNVAVINGGSANAYAPPNVFLYEGGSTGVAHVTFTDGTHNATITVTVTK